MSGGLLSRRPPTHWLVLGISLKWWPTKKYCLICHGPQSTGVRHFLSTRGIFFGFGVWLVTRPRQRIFENKPRFFTDFVFVLDGFFVFRTVSFFRCFGLRRIEIRTMRSCQVLYFLLIGANFYHFHWFFFYLFISLINITHPIIILTIMFI